MNSKMRKFVITLNGVEHVYHAFTKGEARAMAKRALGFCGKHDRLPPGTPVREVGKSLTPTVCMS